MCGRVIRAAGRLGYAIVERTKDIIKRLMAYRIQEDAFGGLDRETKKLLDRLARSGKARVELNRCLRGFGLRFGHR
jgi:hypothetical protein